MSEALGLALRQVVDSGLGLMKRLGRAYRHDQPVPAPEQIQTEAEARVAGVHAAVHALLVAVGPLAGPGTNPSPERGEQALDALRQRRDVLDAYHAAFSETVTHFCVQLEAALDDEGLREDQQ